MPHHDKNVRKLGPSRETRLNPAGEALYQELYNFLEGESELIAQWITEDRSKREGYRNHSGRPPQLRSLLLRRALELGLEQLHAELVLGRSTDDQEALSDETLEGEGLWTIKDEIEEVAESIRSNLASYEEMKSDDPDFKRKKQLHTRFKRVGYNNQPSIELIQSADTIQRLASAIRKDVTQLKRDLRDLEECSKAERLLPGVDLGVITDHRGQFIIYLREFNSALSQFEMEWSINGFR